MWSIDENKIIKDAEIYAVTHYGVPNISTSNDYYYNAIDDFIAGAKSEAAKKYWQNKLKNETTNHG